jgi:hypothetical protein
MGINFLLTLIIISQPPTQWWQFYGGTGDEWGRSVQQTSDGGYIIAGRTESYGAGSFDIWLIKTDTMGYMVWDKTFGETGPEWGESVQQTIDGGYIIAGFKAGTGYDDWLIKTDSLGNMVWDKTFGGAGADFLCAAHQTSDGGYIAAGWTNSFGAGGYDDWLIKTDSLGNKIWDRTFGGAEDDEARDVQETTDGGYIITGYTASIVPGADVIWLIKTDSIGNLVWDTTFYNSPYDYSYGVQETSDKGYIICGFTWTAYRWDWWIIKTDSLGNLDWDKTFGEEWDDYAYDVIETSDSGYVIAGCKDFYLGAGGDGWLIKVDYRGDLIWDKTFGGLFTEKLSSVQQTSDNGYIIAGTYNDITYYDQAWLIKLASETGIEEESQILNLKSEILRLVIYPNPFKQITEIRLQMTDKQLSDISHQSSVSIKIYNSSGRVVKDFSRTMLNGLCPTHLCWFGKDNSGHQVPAGVYFVRLELPEKSITKKIIRLK